MPARAPWQPALLLAALSACVTPASTVIAHPALHQGAIPANRVVQFDTDRAAYFALPAEVFASEAMLLALDTERVCFGFQLRTDTRREHELGVLDWRIYVRADGGFENQRAVFGEPAATTVQRFAGTVPRTVQSGVTMNCAGFRGGCFPMARYIIVRVPAEVLVVTTPGTVCFAHGGRIRASTRHVTLHFDALDDVSRRIAFRWIFRD